MAEQLRVAEQGGGAVVISVEEGEGFFLKEQEGGVEEFEIFGEVVELDSTSWRLVGECGGPNGWGGGGGGGGAYVIKDNQLRRPPTIVIANCVKHAMPDNGGDELFEKQQ